MIFSNFKNRIKKVLPSIIAIGFKPSANQITILGSGFPVSNDGRILSSAHIYNQSFQQHKGNLIGMAMMEQNKNGLNRYEWLPLQLITKDDKDDVVLFQLADYQKTLLRQLNLGNSENIEVGDDVYFAGFPYAANLIQDGFGITLIVNRGIVSNIKRDGQDPEHKRNFIIVDAISNPGNSGCPLIDVRTNKVIGIMAIAFRMQSRKQPDLDIREPMHFCAAKPINLAKALL